MEAADELICLGHDEDPGERHGAVNPPVVLASLFAQPSFGDLIAGLGAEHENYVYTRGRNPTVHAFERKIAALERADDAKAFASGMGAISAVFHALLKSGDHVVLANRVYGPVVQLARHLERFGIEHSTVQGTATDAVIAALKPETRLLYLESPGTMTFRQLDLAALAETARARGIVTLCDNTWATPLFQKPRTLGVDLVVHSATKYFGGHSDVVGGVLAGAAERMREIFDSGFMLGGAAPSPFDAYQLLRGLRTLPARMRQHQADGLRIARHLADHPQVGEVFHPALCEEEAELTDRQLRGFSGLFSFTLKDADFPRLERFVDALRYFRIGVSWGGVESLVISPDRQGKSHHGLPPAMVRLSVGLEGAETLIADLEQAFARIQ